MQSELIRTGEAAKLLRCNSHTLRQYILTGELRAYDLSKPGSTKTRWYTTREAIEDFLKRRASFTPRVQTGQRLRETVNSSR